MRKVVEVYSILKLFNNYLSRHMCYCLSFNCLLCSFSGFGCVLHANLTIGDLVGVWEHEQNNQWVNCRIEGAWFRRRRRKKNEITGRQIKVWVLQLLKKKKKNSYCLFSMWGRHCLIVLSSTFPVIYKYVRIWLWSVAARRYLMCRSENLVVLRSLMQKRQKFGSSTRNLWGKEDGRNYFI